jgi:hypothetical protein
MAALAAASVAAAAGLDLYHPALGLAVVAFMALNAIGAVWPLHRFPGTNPLAVYLGGMVVRLGIIGAALVSVVLFSDLDQASLLAMTLTAMASFVAYMAVEVKHFLSLNALPASRR